MSTGQLSWTQSLVRTLCATARTGPLEGGFGRSGLAKHVQQRCVRGEFALRFGGVVPPGDEWLRCVPALRGVLVHLSPFRPQPGQVGGEEERDPACHECRYE